MFNYFLTSTLRQVSYSMIQELTLYVIILYWKKSRIDQMKKRSQSNIESNPQSKIQRSLYFSISPNWVFIQKQFGAIFFEAFSIKNDLSNTLPKVWTNIFLTHKYRRRRRRKLKVAKRKEKEILFVRKKLLENEFLRKKISSFWTNSL